MIGLGPRNHGYHQVYGFRRGLEYLRSRGADYDYLVGSQIDAKRLAPYRMLFINLVSAERAPFLVSEIAAIKAFVSGGGSLMVITDHSNCYYHAYKLQPLFTELDIESRTHTACDVAPHTLGSGNTWLAVEMFREHPVTIGLQCLGIQTGGCVDPLFAVALTSDRSWADHWSTDSYGEKNGPGFCGNFCRDSDEEGGPLGVVMAKQFGQGRIVVVADQNVFGDAFLNYADNYRLWLNAFVWLLDDERLRQVEPYHRWRVLRVTFHEQYSRAAFGATDREGFFHAFALLSREQWAFANNRPVEDCELVVFAHNDYALPADNFAAVVCHLRRGRNVLLLSEGAKALSDRSGVVGRLQAAVGPSQPARRTNAGQKFLQFPGCGGVFVLGAKTPVDNTQLTAPEREPDFDVPRREEQLLQAVREALPEPAPARQASAASSRPRR